jgi:hypothetical protein
MINNDWISQDKNLVLQVSKIILFSYLFLSVIFIGIHLVSNIFNLDTETTEYSYVLLIFALWGFLKVFYSKNTDDIGFFNIFKNLWVYTVYYFVVYLPYLFLLYTENKKANTNLEFISKYESIEYKDEVFIFFLICLGLIFFSRLLKKIKNRDFKMLPKSTSIIFIIAFLIFLFCETNSSSFSAVSNYLNVGIIPNDDVQVQNIKNSYFYILPEKIFESVIIYFLSFWLIMKGKQINIDGKSIDAEDILLYLFIGAMFMVSFSIAIEIIGLMFSGLYSFGVLNNLLLSMGYASLILLFITSKTVTFLTNKTIFRYVYYILSCLYLYLIFFSIIDPIFLLFAVFLIFICIPNVADSSNIGCSEFFYLYLNSITVFLFFIFMLTAIKEFHQLDSFSNWINVVKPFGFLLILLSLSKYKNKTYIEILNTSVKRILNNIFKN